jgi:enoyl-CoA hydratase/carnithine racemase
MMDLLLTGRKIDAREAVRLGIVTRAVPADQLTGAYEDVLEHLLRGSAPAIRKSKQFVRDCETLTYRQAIEAATAKAIAGIAMPELGEGLSAFLDRERADRS